MLKKVKIAILFLVSAFILLNSFVYLINIILDNSSITFKDISPVSVSIGIFFVIAYIYILNYIVNKDIEGAILLNKESGIIPISLLALTGLAILSVSIEKNVDIIFVMLITIYSYILYDVVRLYVSKALN